MPDSLQFTGLLARPLIEQCRRDIAAAWEQVEAGRRILARSRWLLKRWAEQARAVWAPPVSVGPRRMMGGDFVPVETKTETPRQRLRLRRFARLRARRLAAAARRPVHSPAHAQYPR